MNNLSPDVANEAAKHIRGRTIAWSRGLYFDYDDPEACAITIEDYAFAVAYTVRWRGQTYCRGQRCFFGVGQHCVVGAENMLREGRSKNEALAFLGHEGDEVTFPDFPGPAKSMLPADVKAKIKANGLVINRKLGFPDGDPDLMKRWDIRMLVTEKRDLLPGHERATFSTDGSHMADDRYAPFEERIIPYRHPDLAARRFLQLYHELAA